jgi:PAS domain S-box-containing protein
MKKPAKSTASIASELEGVRARLAEVESTLEAIRSGEVDAVVVNGSRGTQVFTLETADQPYRVMAESMNEGAATVTPDGTILFCNRRFAGMLNCAGEKLVGSSILSRLADFDRAKLDELIGEAMQATCRREANLLREDGLEMPVLLSLDKISLGENGDGVCLVATDLSVQKKRLAELQRAQEEVQQLNRELEWRVEERTANLDSAVKELEAFSHSVSHDLRAPLRAIDGFSQILLQDHAAQLDDDGRHCLDMVRQGAQHMSELMDALLAFSRLARKSPFYRSVDMEALVNDVVEEMRAEHAGRKIQIDVHPLGKCAADPVLLRQVFLNLLSNAVKFTRGRELAVIEVGSLSGEEVKRTTGPTPLAGTAPEYVGADLCVYYVRDNGVGFNMEYADKLFGIFQRLHAREQFEGMGVGLAIARRIVHKHGGRIWADAKPDGGATFFFTLRCRPAEWDVSPSPAELIAQKN